MAPRSPQSPTHRHDAQETHAENDSFTVLPSHPPNHPTTKSPTLRAPGTFKASGCHSPVQLCRSFVELAKTGVQSPSGQAGGGGGGRDGVAVESRPARTRAIYLFILQVKPGDAQSTKPAAIAPVTEKGPAAVGQLKSVPDQTCRE